MLVSELLSCGDLDALEHRTATARGLGPPVAVDAVAFPPETRVVAPREVPRRSAHTPHGRVAMLHALAHIELSAVLLALDHAHRFGEAMGPAWVTDWLGVATEEARHLGLLRRRLAELGAAYGDHPVHDGQWAMAARTAHDPLARMALVPRVAEARGLDVTPGIITALRSAGDDASADVLAVILREEVGHVAVGDRWFRHLCGERDAEVTFRELLRAYGLRLRGPFNYEARAAGGFSSSELDALSKDALGSSI